MKRTTYIVFSLLSLAVLSLVGCSKHEIIIPQENDPVFEVRGLLGNQDFELVAGDNAAFMHTSTKIHNGVRVFTGELSDGTTSVELGIYDGNLDIPNNTPEVDLTTAALKFAQRHLQPLTTLSMESIAQNATDVEWYINGSYAGSGDVPIFEPGKYDVCAFVTFAASGETHELCDEIIVGYQRNANCSISYNYLQGLATANLNTTGEPIQSVEWTLDGNPIAGSNIDTQFQPVYGTEHTLSARVTFTNGVVREKSCFINGSNPIQTISDFSVFEVSSSQAPTPQDYQVRLLIEHDGKKYNSVYGENEGSSITLINLEQYEDNAGGNSVYKATLQIEAVVMEMNTEKLYPVSFTTTLGIEVP